MSSTTESAASAPPMDAVSSLIARRSTIQGWIDRLAQCSDEVPERVQARVRADYEQRLQEVTGQLAVHQNDLRQELVRLSREFGGAAAAHDEASDALEEARLRHRIGELEDDEWQRRRPELEAEVRESAERRDALAGESDRLRELLGLVEAEPQSAPAAPEEPGEELVEEPAAPSAAAVAEEETAPAATEPDPEEESAEPALAEAEFSLAWPALGSDDGEEDAGDEPLPILELAEELVAPGEEAGDLADLAFLEELDRAIAQSGATSTPRPDAAPPEDDTDEPAEEPASSAPAKGVKCLECGYTNDANAWYCGVCGVDLA